MRFHTVFLGLLAAALALRPAPAFGQVRLISDPLRDIQQTIQARRLLAVDPDLEGNNLGVIVRDRVATLWGPAPSAEVAFRAELSLKAMIELVEIRNELFVSDLLEPMRRPVRVDNANRPLPNIKTPAATEARRQALQELPPIPLPELGPPQIEPDASGDRDQRLIEAARAALQGDDRFRAVLFAVKEGRIRLKMMEPDAVILHEAAQIMSHLPNVAAVLVEIKTNPR